MNGITNAINAFTSTARAAEIATAKTVYGPELMIGLGIAILVAIVFMIIAISTLATGHWAVGLIFLMLAVATGAGAFYVWRM